MRRVIMNRLVAFLALGAPLLLLGGCVALPSSDPYGFSGYEPYRAESYGNGYPYTAWDYGYGYGYGFRYGPGYGLGYAPGYAYGSPFFFGGTFLYRDFHGDHRFRRDHGGWGGWNGHHGGGRDRGGGWSDRGGRVGTAPSANRGGDGRGWNGGGGHGGRGGGGRGGGGGGR